MSRGPAGVASGVLEARRHARTEGGEEQAAAQQEVASDPREEMTEYNRHDESSRSCYGNVDVDLYVTGKRVLPVELLRKIIKRTAKALHGHLQGTLNASFDGRVFIGRYAITKRANTHTC